MDAGGRGFSIKRFLEDHISRMGLKKRDALLPLNLGKVARVAYWVMYHALEVLFVGTCSKDWVRLDNEDVQLELDTPKREYAG